MTYIALLRGINVGGKRRVEMKTLTQALEQAGFKNVTTYINSGNVILESGLTTEAVNSLVEKTIVETFGFAVDVITLAQPKFTAIVDAIPSDWTNDTAMKCDVLFLHSDIDSDAVLQELKTKPEIDDTIYVPGAIIWSVARENVTKSGMIKIIGTPIYRKLTIRNCNTARKLVAILNKRTT